MGQYKTKKNNNTKKHASCTNLMRCSVYPIRYAHGLKQFTSTSNEALHSFDFSPKITLQWVSLRSRIMAMDTMVIMFISWQMPMCVVRNKFGYYTQLDSNRYSYIKHVYTFYRTNWTLDFIWYDRIYQIMISLKFLVLTLCSLCTTPTL